jgi:hypothetical protein
MAVEAFYDAHAAMKRNPVMRWQLPLDSGSTPTPEKSRGTRHKGNPVLTPHATANMGFRTTE